MELMETVEAVEKLLPTMTEGDGLLIRRKGNSYRILYGSYEDFKNVPEDITS